jgi:predicted DNA-binding ribbon-helix-helix protein
MAHERTTIYIESALLERLRKLAADDGSSVSSLLTRFAHQGIGDAELAAQAKRDPLTERLIEEMLRPENLDRAARIVGQESQDPVLFRQRAAALGRQMKGVKKR